MSIPIENIDSELKELDKGICDTKCMIFLKKLFNRKKGNKLSETNDIDGNGNINTNRRINSPQNNDLIM
jgi:hypothetical protein